MSNTPMNAVIHSLILPFGRKDCWQECAQQLAGMTDEALNPFLPDLMEWFQDLNWPGTEIIARRLEALPEEKLRKAFEIAKARASAQRDDEWLENLTEVQNMGSRIWKKA